MDLAYVDKLSKFKNGLSFLPTCQDLFDRYVDAKGVKTIGSKGTVHALASTNTIKKRPKRDCFDRGTKIEGMSTNFRNLRVSKSLYNE